MESGQSGIVVPGRVTKLCDEAERELGRLSPTRAAALRALIEQQAAAAYQQGVLDGTQQTHTSHGRTRFVYRAFSAAVLAMTFGQSCL